MKRVLIASITALGIVATPALAASTPAAKPTNASLQQKGKGKVAGAKISKASARTAKDKKSN